MFIAALFVIARTWKQSKYPPTDEWIKKMWYILICTMEYYWLIKKWNNAICSNLDGSGYYHSKWSKSEKDKCHMITLLYGKMMQMNLSKKQLEILDSALRLCWLIWSAPSKPLWDNFSTLFMLLLPSQWFFPTPPLQNQSVPQDLVHIYLTLWNLLRLTLPAALSPNSWRKQSPLVLILYSANILTCLKDSICMHL